MQFVFQLEADPPDPPYLLPKIRPERAINNKPKSAEKHLENFAKNCSSQDAEILLRLLRHVPDARLPVRAEDALRRQEAQGERQVLLPEVDGGAGAEPHRRHHGRVQGERLAPGHFFRVSSMGKCCIFSGAAVKQLCGRKQLTCPEELSIGNT